VAVDPRTPAIVGAAQTIQRPDLSLDLRDLRGPYELMVDAARSAADDAGARQLLSKIDWIAVIGGFWSFVNPGQVIGAQIRSPDARTCLTALSGTSPQEAVALAASRIAAGEIEVALIVGGEARAAAVRVQRSGEEPPWCRDPGTTLPERIADFPQEVLQEASDLGGLSGPSIIYALFEDSLRRARGTSVDQHRDDISRLWARFSAVAATNPYAWDQTAHDAASIRDASPDNRMIAFPYTKAMVANNGVDMGSAVLVCSVDAALAAGVARDRMVFPRVSTASHETWRVAERRDLHRVPALETAGRVALATAGLAIDDIEHIDLYACFPSIVQMSAAALGLDLQRPLTVTGGLGFAGSPIANSSGHAIAAMVPRLREGGHGLIHANGGMATKHAFGIYSSQPPADGFRFIDCNDQVDHQARPTGSADELAEGTEEASTVVYDREGPAHTMTSLLTADGHRHFVRGEIEE
jgi:acetyl-CoA C-acetyltransferase